MANSEKRCNFIILIYKVLQTKFTVFTDSEITEIFFPADEFCKFFDAMMAKHTISNPERRKYHRESTMSKSEVIPIIILFHHSGYRRMKHFHPEKACKHMRHHFPEVVSYNRFAELQRSVAIPLALFVKKALTGKCTGVSFVDGTPLCVCKSQRKHMHKVMNLAVPSIFGN